MCGIEGRVEPRAVQGKVKGIMGLNINIHSGSRGKLYGSTGSDLGIRYAQLTVLAFQLSNCFC